MIIERKIYYRRLDKLTSLIVRKRDKRCCTCGKRLTWNERQAGHYVPRVVERTRWDLENVSVQCAHCNVELGGNLAKYSDYIRNTFGEDTLSRLDGAYDAYKSGKIAPLSLKELCELYVARIDLAKKLKLSEMLPPD